ncbi:three-helix bundle dimerization domain-containing protein [Amycolatopsis sp. NPDC051903]|uniref:three-helix bundle dimerization domain-containing protein n=1 Tax=Amycolatopsis sp. NPDC051903 TaxID=3363936 RepID=UPI0037BCC253
MSTHALEAAAPEQADPHYVHLEARLGSDFAAAGAVSVHELVERERARFREAPIQAFVPILVERAVRAALTDRPLA